MLPLITLKRKESEPDFIKIRSQVLNNVQKKKS